MTRYPPFMLAAATAAILGGTLRIATMLPLGVATALPYLYYVTDIFLMLGLVGWYVSRADRLGAAGLLGFMVATVAILMIRSIDLFGARNYAVGAALLLAGLSLMNVPTLQRRDGAILAPALWLASLACGIAATGLAPIAVALVQIAAVLFAAGFIAAGIELFQARKRP